MSADIANCPFCGSAMQFRAALWPSDGDRDSVIHAEPSECGMRDFTTDTADKSVIAAWNRRASIPPLPSVQAGDLIPKWAGQFDSHQDWVNKAKSRLASVSHRPAICVDKLGRRCSLGADMARARDEDAFPVRYFLECEVSIQPPASTEPPPMNRSTGMRCPECCAKAGEPHLANCPAAQDGQP